MEPWPWLAQEACHVGVQTGAWATGTSCCTSWSCASSWRDVMDGGGAVLWVRPQGLLSQDTAVLGTGWPPLTGCPAVIWIRKTKYFPQVSCCCAPTLSEYIPSTRSVLYSKSCVTVTVRWHLSQYIGFLSLRGTVSRWALASLYSCALHKTSLLFNLPNTEQGHCSY